MLIFKFRLSLVASTLSALLATPAAYSSLVRDDVDYQYFRDFAENKGAFAVGASNVPIYNKQGEQVGTALPNVPMLDLRVANKNYAIATAIGDQYIGSVAHNAGYGSVSFGSEGNNPDEHNFDYLLTARNNHSQYDFHAPRLHKLITEIAPIAVSSVPYENGNPKNNSYTDRQRFSYFVRVGAGTQGTRGKQVYQPVYHGYAYLTGGNPLSVKKSKDHWLYAEGKVQDVEMPLASYGMAGDSGSPLFAFDRAENRWVFVGVLSSYSGEDGNGNLYTLARTEMIRRIKENDEIHLHNQGSLLRWQSQNGSSQILHSNGKATVLPVADTRLSTQDSSTVRPSLENGKTLHLSGVAGTLRLENDINQGAGALYFHNNFTVQGSKPTQIWQGAGVSVDKDSTVQWQVHNPKGDRLSKIGAGTLYVNGQGENQGDISVGDGTLVLAQRALNGKQQAFNQVGIVSGRSTVVLNDGNQVKPDNIYFGFRGGRLDVNGNSLRFQYIQNTDEGARIVNHNPSKEAEIAISGNPLYTEKDIEWGHWSIAPSKSLSLYEYVNIYHGNRKDYFALAPGGDVRGFFPAEGYGNKNWEYLGTNRAIAIKIILDRHNEQLKTSTFSGYFGESDPHKINGKLNLRFQPNNLNSLLVLNGGTNLNGKLSVVFGRMLLSGIPVPHARDLVNRQEVVKEDEWQNRQFKANEFHADYNAVLVSGRNVERLEGNFAATNNSRLHLGFIQNRTLSCVRSDYSGDTHCNEQAVLSEQNFANLPTTQIWGNVRLQDNSRLVLGKSHLHGNIQGGPQTRVDLAERSQWTMNGNSQIGELMMEPHSELTLNDKFEQADQNRPETQFNTLTIDNDLSGSGKIRTLSNAAAGKGDLIVVNGAATGNFVFQIKNTGREPNAVSPLALLRAKNFGKNGRTFEASLENGYVDLGTYRYVLAKQGNEYRLYNPLKAAELGINVPSVPEAEKQFAQIQKQIQQQKKEIERLNQQYQQSIAQEKPLQLQLQQAQKQLEQLEQTAKRSPHHNKNRVPAAYRQLLNRILAARNNVQRLTQNLQQNQAKQQQTLNNLSASKQGVQDKTQQLQDLSRQKLLTQAQKLCMQKQLGESLCHKVAFSANEEALTPTESLLALRMNAVNEAEAALQNAQNNGDEAAIAQAQQRLAQAKAEEEAAWLALENENAELAQAIAQVEPAQAESEPTETAQTEAEAEAEQANSLSQPASSTRQADLISRYANTALSELSATTNASLQLGQNLDRQLLSDNIPNVWVNQQWQKQTPSNDDHRPYEQSLQLTQIGVAQEVQPQWTIGAVLSHSRAQNSFDQGVSGKGNLTSLSLFSKKAWDNGIFASLDTSLGRANSQLDFDGEHIRFHRNLFSLGANLGINLDKQWDLAGWKLQPSVGVRYYRLSGVNYALDQAEIRHSALNLVAYNAGARLSKAFDFKGLRIEPSLSSYYQNARHQSLKTESAMQVNKIALHQSFGNAFRHELALSMQYQQWQLHTHFGIEKGAHNAQQKYAGVKLGYSWK